MPTETLEKDVDIVLTSSIFLPSRSQFGWLGNADAAEPMISVRFECLVMDMIVYVISVSRDMTRALPAQNTVRPMVAIRKQAQTVAMPRGFEEKTDSKLQMRS